MMPPSSFSLILVFGVITVVIVGAFVVVPVSECRQCEGSGVLVFTDGIFVSNSWDSVLWEPSTKVGSCNRCDGAGKATLPLNLSFGPDDIPPASEIDLWSWISWKID